MEASEVVCNLGAYFDKHMTMEHHVKMKCRAAYAQLFTISKIRDYLDERSAEQLIHSLVHSHIDYWPAPVSSQKIANGAEFSCASPMQNQQTYTDYPYAQTPALATCGLQDPF